MSVDTSDLPPVCGPANTAPQQARRGRREVIYRHTVLVRLGHWINAICVFMLIGSGLNIFNAHARLYWGRKGDAYDPALLAIHAVRIGGTPRGITQVGSVQLYTTGWLGWFPRAALNRAWPSWITIPSFQDLADARHWHFFFAWLLIANGLAYLIWSLMIGHVQRDLWPTVRDLRFIPRSVLNHLRNRHPTGEAARRYDVLQKLAYLGLIALVLGMVATGLTMSPGIDAAAPWLLDLFGGRQSARTLHFTFAALIVVFILVHVAEVFLAGPLNEIRSIVTGRYAVPPEHD